jgi:hypothetical protein
MFVFCGVLFAVLPIGVMPDWLRSVNGSVRVAMATRDRDGWLVRLHPD